MRSIPCWWSEWADPHWEDPRYRQALSIFENKSPEKRLVTSWLENRYHTLTRGTLLDVGSGGGIQAEAFHQKGWTLFLNESDPSSAAALTARFVPPHRVFAEDFFELRPQDLGTSCTVVLASHVLYHIPHERWGEFFDRAYEHKADTGEVVIVLRSPGEQLNRLSAALGAPLLDVEAAARKWSSGFGVEIEVQQLAVPMSELTIDDATVLAQFLLKDNPLEDYRQLPELDELVDWLKVELFQDSSCTWNCENSIVILK